MSGFLAGALCVLPLFEGVWNACAEAGLRFEPYPRGGVPLILSLAATGGALGVVFRLTLRGPLHWAWRDGAKLGLLLSLLMWFVLAPLAGAPLAAGWQLIAMARTLAVFVIWGFGLGHAVALLERGCRR